MCNDGATRPDTNSPSLVDTEFRARLRFISLVLLVIFPVGWTAWFYPFDDLFDRSNTQLGGDYPVFHVMARLAADGRWRDMYHFADQGDEIRRFLPGFAKEKFLPALYPPWVPVTILPLGFLPYWASYVVFFVGSLVLIGGTLFAWRRHLHIMRTPWSGPLILASFALPVTCEVLVSGQASILAWAVFGIASALLVSRPNNIHTEIIAGAILALAMYKPNVLGLVVLGIMIRWPRVLLGFIPALLIWITLTWVVGGVEVFESYRHMITSPDTRSALGEPPMHKFPTFASSTPWTRTSTLAKVLCLGLAALLVILVSFKARRIAHQAGIAGFLALLGILQTLGNPYLPIYDLALLAPIAVFIAEACHDKYGPNLIHSKWAGLLVGFLFFGPHLSQAIAQSTGFHLVTWFLIPVGIWLWFRTQCGEFTAVGR